MALHTDPVCGMKVEETQAAAESEYNGRTYYFCSGGCKNKFESNPENYADKAAER